MRQENEEEQLWTRRRKCHVPRPAAETAVAGSATGQDTTLGRHCRASGALLRTWDVTLRPQIPTKW